MIDYIRGMVIFGGITGCLTLLFCLIRRYDLKKTIYWTAMFMYLGALIEFTLFTHNYPERIFNIIPLVNSFKSNALFYHIPQMIVNFAMFIPLGVFLQIRQLGLKKSICIACVLSMLIEITQYITRRGIADIDDLILNTVGALIGFFVIKKIRKNE